MMRIIALILLAGAGSLWAAASPSKVAGGVTQGVQIRVVMQGQRFSPARVAATVVDTIIFELESGGPHNIAFDPDSIPAGALAQLARAMGNDPRFLVTPEMLITRGETFTLPLVGLPPGTYPFICTPHYGSGMRGEIVLRATGEPSPLGP